MTGDCEVVDNCVSSTNYPEPHGHDEECVVTIEAPMVYLTPNEDVFDLEKCCDHLTFPDEDGYIDIHYYYDEDHHPLDNVPEYMTRGEQIHWNSDGSVAHNGWQICFHEEDVGN